MICFVVVALGADMTVDYAEVKYRDAWIRHPVYGDPSFDTFERSPSNPVHVGDQPYEWPVNGFLFRDPKSGAMFLYVGHYPRGYAMDPSAPMRCTVFRSDDHGTTWKHLGPIFEEDPFCFEDNPSPVIHAPDVAVTYHGNRYHLVYDWATADTTWANAHVPAGNADSGIAYAWAERPEGPFHRAVRPIHHVAGLPTLLGKYRRIYAASLVRRRSDWLVLAMMDSGPHFSWALVGCTAREPQGPYCTPAVLLSVERDTYYPPLLEFYPAFTHRGWIYAPATSVALNRNFQVVFRARIEDAMNPNAWKMFQHGSVWHSEPVPHESMGIWGQTYAGFVGRDGLLRVMFPSRDGNGMGTINLAVRPWRRSYRERGFVLSGHRGSSLGLLKPAYGGTFVLTTELTLHGAAIILWDCHAPLGPDAPRSDAALHKLSLTRCTGLRVTEKAWTLLKVDETGGETVLADGQIHNSRKIALKIVRDANGTTGIHILGDAVWRGRMDVRTGRLGILAAQDSHVEVGRFVVEGDPQPLSLFHLYTDALLGAGQSLADWNVVDDPHFTFGIGAVSKHPDARAKWNFEGRSFSLYAPMGPAYGAADLLLDGSRLGEVAFYSAEPRRSAPVFTADGLSEGFHALVIRPKRGAVPIDALEAGL